MPTVPHADARRVQDGNASTSHETSLSNLPLPGALPGALRFMLVMPAPSSRLTAGMRIECSASCVRIAR